MEHQNVADRRPRAQQSLSGNHFAALTRRFGGRARPNVGTLLADSLAPGAAHRELALATRAPVRTLTMRHGGTFCASPAAKPQPIRGTQFFTSDPPGFVWTGRVRLAPGLWIDARDMMVGGAASMRVLLDDTVTLVNARGRR